MVIHLFSFTGLAINDFIELNIDMRYFLGARVDTGEHPAFIGL